MPTGVAAGRAAAGGRLRTALNILWRFSRPHTVIGTALSVLGIYVITLDNAPGADVAGTAGDLLLTLVAAYAVNLFIVGLNQIEDVEIDRVNKPFLPLAAGELGMRTAWVIVIAAGVVPVVLAVAEGLVESVAVIAALGVGVAYSSPPLRLKRYAALAALSISGVRSVIVNLGVSAHFAAEHGPEPAIAPAVVALTLFVIPFSLAIALLKDVPDFEGDRRFRIATYTVRLGGERVLAIGLGALTVAYLGMAIGGALWLDDVHRAFLALSHLAALALLWWWARSADVNDPRAFTRFYMRVWKLFFLEYVLVPAAVVAA
jgi:homogentisate phytyltransferase/homogentisate geranylgeranyltransferase